MKTVSVSQIDDLTAAQALVEQGQDAAKKPAARQAEIIAGFREGGTTFGLNNRPLEIGGRPALAAARLALKLSNPTEYSTLCS